MRVAARYWLFLLGSLGACVPSAEARIRRPTPAEPDASGAQDAAQDAVTPAELPLAAPVQQRFDAWIAATEARHARPRNGLEGIVVELGALHVESGLASAEVLQRVLRANLPQLRYCYEQTLLRNPENRGHAVLRGSVNSVGAVSASGALRSSFAVASTTECMARVMRRWVFLPAREAGPSSFVVPLVARGFSGGRPSPMQQPPQAY